MDTNKIALNRFLVDTFNDILRYEEMALEHLTNNRLSISEVHLLEAVFEALPTHQNTPSGVAPKLGITLGSLTTAVKTLEKKGYLVRQRAMDDKRVYYLVPTPIADFVNQKHLEFHKGMIEEIVAGLTLEEEQVLAKSLEKVRLYFGQKAEMTRKSIAERK